MNQNFKYFISKKLQIKPEEIDLNKKLSRDFGCCGMDALELFEDFFTTFNITNTDEFDSDLHIDGGPDFGPRPLSFIKNLLNRKRWKYLRPDVSIRHLEKVAEEGRWFNES